jgi:UDP-N-acetylglucosamine transferase subunit ALG13
MPRLKKYCEVVNDHQLAIAKKFSELGHILVAYDTEDLPERIHQLKTFVPKEKQIRMLLQTESVIFLTICKYKRLIRSE